MNLKKASKNNTEYEIKYNKTADFIRNNKTLYNIFKVIYKYIPYGTMFAYGALILWHCVYAAKDVLNDHIVTYETVAACKVILVPLTGFIIISLLRKVFNFERPYTKYNIRPLIIKQKVGESFPSRHTFSIAIIAMAFLYTNTILGIIMLMLMIFLAISRVIAGVHFARDVIGAAIIAVLWGVLGFYII